MNIFNRNSWPKVSPIADLALGPALYPDASDLNISDEDDVDEERKSFKRALL